MGILLCSLQSVWGQIQPKKNLEVTDYKKWHYLISNEISDDGKWVTYTHHYQSNSDTLFIINTASLETHAFAKGFNSRFNGPSQMICQQPDNKLTIFDLKNKTSRQLENVVEYDIGKNNQGLVLQQTLKDKTQLLITDSEGNTLLMIPHVRHWKINHGKTKVAYILEDAGKYSVHIIDLDKKRKQTTLFENQKEFHQLEWNQSGTALAFLSGRNTATPKNNRGAVYLYQVKSGEKKVLYLEEHPETAPNSSIGEYYTTEMWVSDDGERVFFGLEETKERLEPNPEAVQVWNTADKSIYPGKIQMNDWRRRPIIAVWWPKTGKARQITDNNLPFLQLDAKLKYAITSNPLAYEPQFKYYGDRDFYITNLETGEKKIFLKAASGEPSNLVAAPDGKYMLYFQKYKWWSYNLATEQHTLLTKGIKLVETETDDANVKGGTPSAIAGFTMADEDVLLYDAYDLWKVKTDGTSFEKMTNGRETKTRFSCITKVKPATNYYDGYQAPQIDATKPIYFSTLNETNEKNGIAVYESNKHLKIILNKNKAITDICLTKDSKKLRYTEQDFDVPPQLVLLDSNTKKEKVIHQSNPQQAAYYYGKASLFSFDVQGENVGGVLLYPANYDPKKKYPMIVHVYQRQAMDVHTYQNPSLLDSRGFNPTNFTTQGYFVCLPNMQYETGNTGEAATRCVNAAVQAIIDKDIIDKDRIGLIGHSYGGYETNFIITQKNPFKTAISGASYSDLAADYLHIAWDYKTADYRRYEYGQMRMGTTLFEDPARYHRNSPILLAKGVTIPVLLWSGHDDKHVDVNHSYKFHMALRRLKKENVLLIYPQEKHVIQNPKNQIDLSIKIKEWFDYYLKDGEFKPWMAPDFVE